MSVAKRNDDRLNQLSDYTYYIDERTVTARTLDSYYSSNREYQATETD
jgi:hypothetical protein